MPLTAQQQQLVDEALVLNDGLEQMAEEGIAAFSRANPLVRAMIAPIVRRGTGTTLEGLRDEAHAKTQLLAAMSAGEADLGGALPELRRWRERVLSTGRFVRELEPMARSRIKDPATRERIEAMARERLAGAERLGEVLAELTR